MNKSMNLIKGQLDISMFIPVVIGLLYAGTGNWSESRWTGALAIMGMGPAARMGYEKGYWTENPTLTRVALIQPRELVEEPKQQIEPAQQEEEPQEPSNEEPAIRLRDEHGRFISKSNGR